MENPIDKKHLISYISGNATPNLKRQIELWLDSDPGKWDIFYQYLEEWERSKAEPDFDSYTEFIHITGRIFSAEPFTGNSAEEKNKAESNSLVKPATDRLQIAATGKRKKWLTTNSWKKMAAAVTFILLLSGLAFFYPFNRFTTYAARNRIKKVVLPDNSTVILNAGAEIKYTTDWTGKEVREVWLEGEAFFSVTHTGSHQKFIVHTSDQVDVEVIGTQFNVSRSASRTRVVLNDGKINLHIKDNSTEGPAIKNILMQPGELVEFGTSARQLTRKTVNPDIYSAWKDNRLVFDNSTLPELTMLLEERYKLKVIVSDTSLNNIRFNGDFPSEDLRVLLNALAVTYNLQVSAGPDKVYLKSKSVHHE